jgi:hypothetical protein
MNVPFPYAAHQPVYCLKAANLAGAGRRRKTARVKALTPARAAADPPARRHRRQFCDCGRVAVTVKLVKVGTNPQYTIRLPLCKACLKLEQEMRLDLE